MCLCFDSNFDEFQTNENIYLKTAQPLISHVFNGGKVRERERERERERQRERERERESVCV